MSMSSPFEIRRHAIGCGGRSMGGACDCCPVCFLPLPTHKVECRRGPADDPAYRARVTKSDMARTIDAYVSLKRQRLVEQGMHFWDADRIAAQEALGVVIETLAETRWERLRRRLLRRTRPVIYRDASTADFPLIVRRLVADRVVKQMKESPWR